MFSDFTQGLVTGALATMIIVLIVIYIEVRRR